MVAVSTGLEGFAAKERGGSWRRRAVQLGAVLGLALGLGACTGSSPLGLSPQQEAKIGAQEHPKILAAYGGAVKNQALSSYVAGIAGRLRANSDTPNMPLTVTVLDSPIVNAFALPGGYVYTTRGLVALANSEAELAGVLGHEMGHVVARHTAKRVERANVTGLASVLAGVLLGQPQLANLANQAGQLYLLNYSRGQEYEADTFGVRYLAATGYDPYAQADFLASMGAHGNLSAKIAGQQRPPEFLSSHPSTPKRVEEAINDAKESGVPVSRNPRNRAGFLNKINNMIYGDSRAQGYVRGRTFIHPDLRFRFSVPQGYRLINTPSAVIARGPNVNVQLAGGSSAAAPGQYVSNDLSQALKIQLQNVQNLNVNGMSAATGTANARTQSGNVFVRVVAIKFNQNRYFNYLVTSPTNNANKANQDLQNIVNSFRKISAKEANSVKPRRIKVVKVRQGDTVSKLANRMRVDDYKVERFRVLNALGPNEGVRPGDSVKIVIE